MTFSASSLLARAAGNQATQVNPSLADIDLTTSGSSFLWFVFTVMAATAIGTSVWAFTTVEPHRRVFHFLTIAILTTASVAYFGMASNLGETPVQVEFIREGGAILAQNGGRLTRGIWYARYIDWTITTPLLLLEILLVSGVPTSTILLTIFMDIVMIVTGLVGALVPSTYKWGFFSIGCVAMFFVFWILYGPAHTSAKSISADNGKVYFRGAIALCFLWFLYPIAWGLADGGNVISTDGEMVFYGVLDLLAKPVFAIYHLWALRSSNFAFIAPGTAPDAGSHGTSTGHGRADGQNYGGVDQAQSSALPKRHSAAATDATIA
ncbi:unnamed protein product [Tilletia controversa]|uniref:Opsin-1 n=3 Tax=Tilletia TaxID=13289 RepID=A0A8X7MVD5_9BASI|nr:hypothetical protein CF336_g5090 [Tilletia laevis]KAE8194463.1 hypothetical protein CF328_g4736 [Tilletia controversa]KAE8258736.1 hypothetical protein A4X03_0g4293 [Tilletia caries]KAE8195202.1 hypothetical protein CF335_g5149 [Tilletia laevis]KAE8251388.1 hypothetical protein A4X06_0g2698 [Tilletia controversa]